MLTLVQRLKAVVVAVAAAVDELLTGACRCVVQVGGLCCAAPTDRLGQEAFVCTSPCTSYQHSPSYHSIPSSTARRPSSGFYSATDRAAEYCDERVCVCVCVCVCVSVCPRSCLRNYTSDLHHVHVHHCDCMLPMAVARSSSGRVETRYVLPVLWMTSYLHIGQG